MTQKQNDSIEVTTDIWIHVPLTDEEKGQMSIKMLDALDQIELAEIAKKEYPKERKDEQQRYVAIIARQKLLVKNASTNTSRSEHAEEMLSAMNALKGIENEIDIFKTKMDLKIAECRAVAESCRIDLTTGKSMKWMPVKMLKDYRGKSKTYFNIETGEAIKTVAMTEDELQMEFHVE